MKFINLVGSTFTRLKVLKLLTKKNGQCVYNCVCTCGQRKNVRASNLRSKHVMSCGCLNAELSAARKRTHGMRHTPTYSSYSAAKARCNNPHNRNFRKYGARGIKFLFASFEAFLAELDERPVRKTLDRYPNPAGNYEPGNVRWATPFEQRHNRRKKGQ